MNKILLIIIVTLLSVSTLSAENSGKKISIYQGYRYAVVPDFILDPFFENFKSVSANSFHTQIFIKKNEAADFAYSFEIDYMNITADPGYWNQEGEAKDYMIIDTTYLNLGINFNWFLEITPKINFISSFGVGVGVMLGKIDQYDTNGITFIDYKRFEKKSKKPPVFGHILMNFAFQYEVYKIDNRNPIFFKLDFGFKDLFYAGASLGYQF